MLTHAHEDHVGGLPYLLREVRVAEIWGTRLTLGLVNSKLDEHGLLRASELKEIDPEGAPVELGPFRLEFVRMSHSIPDAVGICIETAAGRVFHTGDWKLDYTPVDGLRTDVGKLAELGNRGVDLLLGDSTNAERPGFTESERVVGEAFRQIIPARHGRVLISSFASNIHRMQQAIDVAGDVGRKVSVVGRSMRQEPQRRAQPRLHRGAGRHDRPPRRPRQLPPERAADHLHRVAGRAAVGADPDRLQRPPRDPGRARGHRDHLGEAGSGQRAARPRHDQPPHQERRGGPARGERAVHVSGHARAMELRTLLSLVRPKAVMPIHGEYRMQAAHARLAQDAGVPADSIVIAVNGDVVELTTSGVRIVDHIEAGVTFVDGLGVGDISDVALRDRRHLSEDGVLIVVTTLSDGTVTRARGDLPRVRGVRGTAVGDAPGGLRHRPRAARG